VGAQGLAQVVTVAESVGTVLSVVTYERGRVTGVNGFNAPTAGGASITISGTHGISATQKARFGSTACSATVWQSASSVVCKAPMGNQGPSYDVVVTAGRPYTIQNALEYDIYRPVTYQPVQDEKNNLQKDVIFIEAQNLGS